VDLDVKVPQVVFVRHSTDSGDSTQRKDVSDSGRTRMERGNGMEGRTVRPSGVLFPSRCALGGPFWRSF
jgi:hypothetical protein